MTSLTAIFGHAPDESAADSEKLLELYWNRAELKKEFASLREQTFRLQDDIKVEKGRTARAEQKLRHLEALLLDPEWMYNAVVHYQLKALNTLCTSKMAAFAEHLKQQREQRQHRERVKSWNAERQAEGRLIETRVLDLRQHVKACEARLAEERQQFANTHRVLRFFRKRPVKRRLEAIAADIAAAQERESQYLGNLQEIRNRQAPEIGGLAIASKRSINFMILSFAQQLYLHFGADDIAGMAKDADEKSVGAMNYGSRTDCEYLLKLVAERGDTLPAAAGFADILQQRARLLSDQAVFKADDAVVPNADSVATLFDIDADGQVRKATRNLLGENFWNLSVALCH